MGTILTSIPFALMTVLCWGAYGPALHAGKHDMGDSSLRQLLCVGLSYFVVAVITPILVLRSKGEKGQWSKGGIIWGLAAGTCGALGALGIITALNNGASPIYVMPIVFGGAPVVNTLVSMWMTKTFKEGTGKFYLGILLVVIGAAGVMYFKPPPIHIAKGLKVALATSEVFWIFMGISLTVLCWGSYGSILHKSQAKMGNSRLRPLLCVGLAYFGIAVIVPLMMLNSNPPQRYHAFHETGNTERLVSVESLNEGATETKSGVPVERKAVKPYGVAVINSVPALKSNSEIVVQSEPAEWKGRGAIFSLLAGALGAFGALGIILSFTFGGRPVFIMPIVFGGAPIINTLVAITGDGTWSAVTVNFVAALVIVIAGAVVVLISAPRPAAKKPPAAEPSDDVPASPWGSSDDDADDSESVREDN